MLSLLWSTFAAAATLPGVTIPFDVAEDGRWTLGAGMPEPMAQAGAQPGWVLLEVDGLAFQDPEAVRRRVASGPARDIQLRFATDPEAPPEEAPEAIIVAPRAPLVSVQELETLPWPKDFATPAGPFQEDWAALPVVPDANNAAWLVDVDAGGLLRSGGTDFEPAAVPTVFWNLSSATWALDLGGELTVDSVAAAREALPGAARIQGYKGRSGDHILLKGDAGIRVLAVEWPRGTAVLPTCRPQVPETCLASGSQILRELGQLPGAVDEAQRHLGIACAGGVNRACYEAVALDDPASAPTVEKCLDGDVGACNDVADARFRLDPEDPDDLVLGLLEYACEVEGSGTLGERLRRLEDVGRGCMSLSAAYDARGYPDQALLNLDQACVLGRADACEEAAERRYQAYALRTVRECEDPELPIAISCVELGRLQQENTVPVATLDDFAAFLRGCSLGATEGCLLLGDYVDRWGIDNPRVVQADSELRAACDQGEQRACLGAAHLLVRHEPRSDAYGEALVLFDKACGQGLGDACVAGAEQRRIGAARKVEAASQLDMWTTGCDLNDPDGCAGLGEKQERSKKTWTEAYAAWTRACDLGDAHSCSELGRLVGEPHDPWEGEQTLDSYLVRGCDNGDPEGCFWLAELDLPSKGEPSEPAYVLLDRSCEGEYGPGCARLAEVHLDRATSFDDEIAARHLDTACDNSDFESCKALGTMYLRGKGVERDRVRAKELFDRFRFNAKRRHVRLGLTGGLPSAIGAELEAVVPIPIGPALSVGGTFSYIPGGGSVLVLIEGEDSPRDPPDLQVLQAIGRLYPNHQGRGLYGAIGFHQLTAAGGSIADRSRAGFNGRVGIRSQSGATYSTLEFGLGNYGIVDLSDFDEDENGKIPLLLPTFSFGVGFAFL